MVWEFTSTKGLNYATDGRRQVHIWSNDTRTGRTCHAYGFDVGQPLASPPIHPAHKNIGIGEIRRILRFPSLHELSFAFSFQGQQYVLEFDGRSELRVTIHGPDTQGRIRHYLAAGHDEVELLPGRTYELGERLCSFDGATTPPETDFSAREALRQCVYTNTVRAPNGSLYVPVNRAWVAMVGRLLGLGDEQPGPLLYIWDAVFNTILAARVDPDLATSNYRLLMEQCDIDGFFHQVRYGGRLNNLTNQPLLSLGAMAIYEATANRDFIAEVYGKLLAFNRWLRRHRDKNGDGLLEWGYEPQGRGIELVGRYAPAYESGLDDSPMWQHEPVDEQRRAMQTSAVCLNSIHALDCRLLARMAEILRRFDEAAELRDAHDHVRILINAQLWDSSRQIYANRRWSGAFSAELSPTSFFPLLTQIPDRQQARALVKHLDDPQLFGGEWRLPSVARSSAHFAPHGDYWRGRIWPPLNYLVLQGLKKNDDAAALRLAEDSQRLFLQEWLRDGHVHENYCADTGDGEAPPGVYYRSCPFYTWGGLLLLT